MLRPGGDPRNTAFGVLRKRDGNDPRCSGHSAVRLPEVVRRAAARRDSSAGHASGCGRADRVRVHQEAEELSEGGPHSGDSDRARNASWPVHNFSVMELCSSYRPWHDKRTGLTHLRPDQGKCVYYYFTRPGVRFERSSTSTDPTGSLPAHGHAHVVRVVLAQFVTPEALVYVGRYYTCVGAPCSRH